jgi:hypothetical protein
MRMREKILSVVEGEFTHKDPYTEHYEGVTITTDKQQIRFGISNGQACCENWGYISSEDSFEDFIGAEVLGVNTVDSGYFVAEKLKADWVSVEDCVFINVETSKGTLQFTVYNEHNGYYSHEVVILQEKSEEVFNI